MKIIFSDDKQGLVKFSVDDIEDLWYLSHIISPGDSLKGSTERKIKLGGDDVRNQKVIRKKVSLTISVEKVSFIDGSLRVLGVITDGPDDVARGDHHSFSAKVGDVFSLKKSVWALWQKEKLQEAQNSSKSNILAVLFDRESALFALFSGVGHKVLATLSGNVQKKDVENVVKHSFWKTIASELKSYVEKFNIDSVIAASPAFWKDYVKSELDSSILKKVVFATVSDVSPAAINELSKRPELKSALELDRGAKESLLFDNILKHLSTDSVAYGLDEVSSKASEGSLKNVLVSQSLISKMRDDDSYALLDNVLKSAEAGNAKIFIITSKDVVKQLDGLSGIAGLKRW